MNINAGVPIQGLSSKLHDVDIQKTGANTAHIKLKDKDKIPNRDFIATWNVAQDSVQSGYLTHRNGKDGFFTLMMIPPKRVTPKTVQPKEMVFLLDCSGSQSGLPIQKAKETMEYILEHMNPHDSFQIIAFNNGFTKFPEMPQVASASMRENALTFIHGLQARGGTWMAPAVEAACALPNPEHKLRIVTFMTDGFVGNDAQIIGIIKKYRDQARWFSFGTGNSVNRFLIDNIAKEGGGEADYVLLTSSAAEVGKKFYDRISSPVLTDLKIEFKGVETKEVMPKDLMDLWAQRPLYFTGRYLHPGEGKVILTGFSGGKPYRQEMSLNLPAKQDSNDVIPSLWARAKIERLTSEDWFASQTGNLNKELKDEIVDTALKYHIMSQYTSFVAVEEDRKTAGGRPSLVAVPVETPQGVQPELQMSRPMMHSPRRRQAAVNMPSAGPVGFGGGAGSASSPAMPNPQWSRAKRETQMIASPSAQGDFSYSTRLDTNSRSKVSYGPGGGGGMSRGGSTDAKSLSLPPNTSGGYIPQPTQAPVPLSMASQPSYMKPTAVPSGGPQPVRAGVANMESAGASSALPSGSTTGVHGSLMKEKSRAPRLNNNFVRKLESNEEKRDEKAKDKDQESDALRSNKLDKPLQILLEKIAKGQPTGKLVEGQILIRIDLTSVPNQALLDKLKSLGLEITRHNAKFVVGRIAPKAINDLLKLSEVLMVKLG